MNKSTGLARESHYNRGDMIYCGQEGFLTREEFKSRTEQAIDRYFKDQPLKARQAMGGGHSFFVHEKDNRKSIQ